MTKKWPFFPQNEIFLKKKSTNFFQLSFPHFVLSFKQIPGTVSEIGINDPFYPKVDFHKKYILPILWMLKNSPFYCRMDFFLIKKAINVFQLSIPHLVLTFKQRHWPIPDVRVNYPILGPKIAHFTLKMTFHKKNLAMFLYFERLTLCKILNDCNKPFPR